MSALIPWDDEPNSWEDIRNAFGNADNWHLMAQFAPDVLARGVQIYTGDYAGALTGAHKYFKGAYDMLRTNPRMDEGLDLMRNQDDYENKRAQKAQARAKQGFRGQRGYRRAGRRRARMRYQYYGFKPPKTPYYYRYM